MNWQELQAFMAAPPNAPPATGWRALLRERLCAVASECTRPGWDGYGAKAVNVDALADALRFVELLPGGMTMPEVVPEPDGSLAFEWRRGRAVAMSVTVSGGMLIFAAIFGAGQKKHGKAKLGETLPPIVLALLDQLPNGKSPGL